MVPQETGGITSQRRCWRTITVCMMRRWRGLGSTRDMQERKFNFQEFVSPGKWERFSSPRILHSHIKLCDSPNGIAPMKIKVLYTMRDQKDVAVSLYRVHYGRTYNGSFEDFLDLFLQGRIDNNGMLDHLLDAELFHRDHPDVPFHFQVYEENIKLIQRDCMSFHPVGIRATFLSIENRQDIMDGQLLYCMNCYVPV